MFRARTVTVPFTVYRRYLAYRLVPCTAGIHHSGMPVQKNQFRHPIHLLLVCSDQNNSALAIDAVPPSR